MFKTGVVSLASSNQKNGDQIIWEQLDQAQGEHQSYSSSMDSIKLAESYKISLLEQ